MGNDPVPGAGPVAADDQETRLTAWVRGTVQGVGFRWWVRSRALELALRGHAANLADGRVEVVAEGRRADCRRLLELLRAPDPSTDAPPVVRNAPPRRPGRVAGVTENWTAPRGLPPGFVER